VTNDQQLRARVEAIVKHYGGVRPAGRALRINYAYLSRLRTGEKSNPTAATLRKLGLRKLISYAPLKTVLEFEGERLELR
jgi:hypothetical protein